MTLSTAEALTIIKPLSLFIVGVVVYAIFVFKFYRFLARKDLIKADFAKYNTARHPFIQKTFAGIIYTVKYIILVPICISFWVAILTVLLTFLSKNQDISEILLIAMALVGSVRIVAYYSEDLAKDLAKMLPFALLGVFLVDASYFNIQASLDMLEQLPAMATSGAYYFLAIACLEIAMRILHALFGSPSSDEAKDL